MDDTIDIVTTDTTLGKGTLEDLLNNPSVTCESDWLDSQLNAYVWCKEVQAYCFELKHTGNGQFA